VIDWFLTICDILIFLVLILILISQHQREKYRRETYELMTKRMDNYGKRLDHHGRMLGLQEEKVYFDPPIARKTLGFMDESPNPFPDEDRLGN
jgi:hypothetical protein